MLSASNKYLDSLESELENAEGKNKIEIYNDLASYYYKVDKKEKSLEYANKALNLSRDIGNKLQEAYSYRNMGKAHYSSGEYEMAINYFNFAYRLFEELNNKEEIAKTFSNFGSAYLKQHKYDKSMYFYKKALKLREELKDYSGMIKINLNLGLLYQIMNNYQKSIKLYKDALDIAEKHNEERDIARINSFISKCYYKWDKYNKASEYALKELKYWESQGDKEKIGAVINFIGKLYYDWQNYEKAIEYYIRYLNIAESLNDSVSISKAYINIGNIYFDWSNYEKAQEYYGKSLEVSEKITETGSISENAKIKTKNNIAILYNNLGMVNKKMEKYQAALDYCKKSLEIKEELGEEEKKIYPLTSIGEIYLKTGNYDQAAKYAKESLEIAKKTDEMKLIQDAYYLLYEVYSASKRYDMALNYHIKYSAIKDSILNEKVIKNIEDLRLKYETEKKEQELEKKATENELLRNKNAQQLTFFIIVSGLILIILAVIFSRYRQKQKANQMLSEKNTQIVEQHRKLEKLFKKLAENEEKLREANATKDKFFSIIAHDLKNPLQSLLLSSDLLVKFRHQFDEVEMEKKHFYIRKTAKHMSELLESLLQWARTQTGRIDYKPERIDISLLVKENITVLYPNASKKDIEFDNKVRDNTFVHADKNMLTSILRNLLNNAIKFSNKGGKIETIAIENGEFMEVIVKDNGIGISKEDQSKLFRLDVHHTTMGTDEEKGTGLGLILCKEFVEIHGGRIDVESEQGMGSTFKFYLPKNYV